MALSPARAAGGGVPAGQLRAAGVIGRLLGRGALSLAECRAALAAATNTGGSGTCGRFVVLWHAMGDAAREEARARARAARFVRAALREGMRAGLDGAGLRDAAARAGRGVLDGREIADLAAGEIGLGGHGARPPRDR